MVGMACMEPVLFCADCESYMRYCAMSEGWADVFVSNAVTQGGQGPQGTRVPCAHSAQAAGGKRPPAGLP